MWGHLHCTWKKEWNAAAEAGASCCHASSSLCTGASQMKIRQDEKQQLCSLWDQLKTVLQLEQKEVKSDHSCKGTQGQRARHSSCLYSSCLLMQKAVGFLVSSGGAYGPWQSHEDMFSVDSGTDGVGPLLFFSCQDPGNKHAGYNEHQLQGNKQYSTEKSASLFKKSNG